jgi:Brp/Blh family beta-carotene 15,15'-monooxygenase
VIASATHRRWLIRHAAVFSSLGFVVLACSAFFGSGATGWHLTLLVILLAVVGIPHGALDYALAKQFLRPRLGPGWVIHFLAAYTLVMAAVLVFWWIHPTASFVAFLALTLYHFGSGDRLATPATPIVIRFAEVLARGGLLLTLPTAFNRQEVLQLFSYLIPEPAAGSLVSMLIGSMPLFLVCLLVCISWSSIQFIRCQEVLFLVQAVELAVLAALFIFLPALLAFGVYFNFLHAVRHMLCLSTGAEAGSAAAAVAGMIRLALPLTAATLVLGGTVYYLLSGVSFDTPMLVRVIFIGIAGMTYPHALVVALAGHAGAIPLLRKDRPEPTLSGYGY